MDSDFIMQISAPWPASILNPNRKSHWAVKKKRADIQRDQVAALVNNWTVKAGGVPRWISKADRLHLWLCFQPPRGGRRDDDNLVRAFKSGRDAIAARLRIDDRVFRTHSMIASPRAPGSILVMITLRMDHPQALEIFGP